MYFGKFNKITYQGKSVTDITNSILLKYRPMNNTTLFTYHTVIDGETAESIAHKYYGKATDHWIILLLNNIVDPYFGWVLTSQEISALVKSKYGEDNVGKINYLFDLNTRKRLDEVDQAEYVNSNGDLIKQLPAHIQPITNTDVEVEINDAKREIKILAPQYVQDFKNQFEDLMNGDAVD